MIRESVNTIGKVNNFKDSLDHLCSINSIIKLFQHFLALVAFYETPASVKLDILEVTLVK